MLDIIIEHWDRAVLAISAVGAWFVSRKQKEIELKKSAAALENAEVGNVQQNLKLYQGIIDDLENRFHARVVELEADLERMKVLNEELRTAISEQHEYIAVLKNQISEYERLEKQN